MAMAEKSNNERGICQWLLVSFFLLKWTTQTLHDKTFYSRNILRCYPMRAPTGGLLPQTMAMKDGI